MYQVHNSLSHIDNRKYFSGLSNKKSKRSANGPPGKESGRYLEMFLLKKGNFVLIYEFKYG